MLEKTLALLNDIPAGTYVPEEKKCYDDGEIEQLSQALKRLVWAPSSGVPSWRGLPGAGLEGY